MFLVMRSLRRDAEARYRRLGVNADTLEYRNATLIGELIVRSALGRRESRGLHERTDFPMRDDNQWRRDTILVKSR